MTHQLSHPISRHRRGTSLIEVLVVIVILLIGILAILQVFPGGFRVLSTTANNSMATALARSEIERLKARADVLAEMVLSVNYSFTGTTVNIQVDTDRDPNNLGLIGDGIDSQGFVVDAGNNYGAWQYLSAANAMRRIVGEGGKIPAPRPVGAGNELYGGLMVLQFSPIVYNAAYPQLFQVYGNDMVRRHIEQNPGLFGRGRDYEFYLENAEEPNGLIWLPRGPTDRQYRIVLSAWVNDGSESHRHDVIDQIIPVPAGTGYLSFNLSDYAGVGAGETYLGAEYDSIRVNRLFREIPVAQPWSTNDVYEYKLLDSTLGTLLFNPNGYNSYVRRPGQNRVPLTARVNYDVYDWRIIRDEFRIAASSPFQHKLILNNLKVKGNAGPDGRVNSGLNVLLPDHQGNLVSPDFALMDLETGGIFLEFSATRTDNGQPRRLWHVDKSSGLLTFFDADQNLSNGLTQELVLPASAAASDVDDARGRSVRALYQANGEWSIQILKAASRYRASDGAPGFGQFFIANADSAPGLVESNRADPRNYRIYFAPMENGKKVTVGEIWYLDDAGQRRSLQATDFLIRRDNQSPLAFVDIRDVLGGSPIFDRWSYGYAARGVKGASVGVRVLWNPAFFSLGADAAQNYDRFEVWGQNWRRTNTETFLQRSDD
ncbi:MAG TPA: prepilin-type N-terminal cleavage/methylation domain-containing protein [Fimbriimonadaceae bacterium]|nr:prepilin-type N-terminal cleavage/methylation domain-containing protein [Fimbriimonadaceae bacterium]